MNLAFFVGVLCNKFFLLIAKALLCGADRMFWGLKKNYFSLIRFIVPFSLKASPLCVNCAV